MTTGLLDLDFYASYFGLSLRQGQREKHCLLVVPNTDSRSLDVWKMDGPPFLNFTFQHRVQCPQLEAGFRSFRITCVVFIPNSAIVFVVDLYNSAVHIVAVCDDDDGNENEDEKVAKGHLGYLMNMKDMELPPASLSLSRRGPQNVTVAMETGTRTAIAAVQTGTVLDSCQIWMYRSCTPGRFQKWVRTRIIDFAPTTIARSPVLSKGGSQLSVALWVQGKKTMHIAQFCAPLWIQSAPVEFGTCTSLLSQLDDAFELGDVTVFPHTTEPSLTCHDHHRHEPVRFSFQICEDGASECTVIPWDIEQRLKDPSFHVSIRPSHTCIVPGLGVLVTMRRSRPDIVPCSALRILPMPDVLAMHLVFQKGSVRLAWMSVVARAAQI